MLDENPLRGGGLEWMRDAACAESRYDGDDWFPGVGKGAAQATERAKRVCRRCLCQVDCLAYAISQSITEGTWGGATPNERNELTRSGRLDGGLIERWGIRAMEGRLIERDREYDARRWAEISARLGLVGDDEPDGA